LPHIVHTSVSRRRRTIQQLLDSGDTDRFALIRRPDGDIAWFQDVFAGTEWTGHVGRVTVAYVLERAPLLRREILRWTREEIEDGPDDADSDIFVRDIRRRALKLLAAELVAVTGDEVAA
jgi:hypothetical protein